MGSPRGAGTRFMYGKMMPEDLDQTAAAYALGILRGAPRAAIEARVSSDLALQAKIKLWQENFIALDLAAGRQVPPAGLFDTIVVSAFGHSDPARRNRHLDRDVAGSDLYDPLRRSGHQAAFDARPSLTRSDL